MKKVFLTALPLFLAFQAHGAEAPKSGLEGLLARALAPGASAERAPAAQKVESEASDSKRVASAASENPGGGSGACTSVFAPYEDYGGMTFAQ